MKRVSGRMWFFVASMTVLCVTMGLAQQWAAYGQEKPKPGPVVPNASNGVHEGQPVSFWMKKKLDFSKNILEGIAMGDFDKASQNAKTLKSLSKIEAFVRRGTPGYRGQVDAFDRSLDEIIRHADKENIEGMTLGFQELTASCVKCHRELRETK